MSREVKRVPLDFNHPLTELWPGYVAPAVPNCEAPGCEGQGSTAAYKWLHSLATLMGMLGEDLPRQPLAGDHGKLHPYLGELMNRPTTRPKNIWDRPTVLRPSADILEFLTGLTGLDEERLTGWLANPSYQIQAALIEKAGLPDTWGYCPECKGSGQGGTQEQRDANENFQSYDPPKGEGWQLWETTSEGSPITPVFATKEALARHIASPAYQYGAAGRAGISLEAATAMVNAGWAPTAAFTSGRMVQAENVPLELEDTAE